MFFTLNIYLYLPELVTAYQKKEVSFVVYCISYCVFDRDYVFCLKYIPICISIYNGLNLLFVIQQKEMKYQRLTIIILAPLSGFRS